ncbi:MAG TPA: amidohydrolase family protein [Gemmatimonadaceae bacterium]|nr:amidohydrolase family protein [Gemmatimonadaceae bacterium]
MRLAPFSLLITIALPAFLPAQRAPADLIVTNARIYTVDANRPFVEAMVVAGGKVVFTGPARAALTYRGTTTRILDAQGQTVIPGMIDAHVHLLGLGTALRTVDLVGTTSYDQVIQRVAARAAQLAPGTWITGRGWDQNDWGDTRFPSHDALTRAVPNHPVYLTRVDGHAALVNAAAMKAANLVAASQDPSGGRIVRGASNEPTGVLVDRAMGLVGRVIPPLSKDEQRAATLAAIRETNKWGLTGVHDAGVGKDVIDVFEELAKAGQYSLRNYIMVANNDAAIDHYLSRGPQSGLYDGRLWIRAIKISADGALGSRGAALIEPYTDEPANRGLIIIPEGRVKAVALKALPKGFQVNVHAIGDRANRVVLDEMEAALRDVPVPDHRFRIEHAQIVHSDDIPRFAQLGVIPSMQASHQTSDMYWAGNRIGPFRLLGAYAWRSLLSSGVVIPNGSDFPVEKVNPLISFHSAVARQDEKDWPEGGWFPEQRMTREEALKSMTLWPAYAAFMEKEVGSLEPGKLADFVILDQDIMRVPNELILRTRVVATYLGGKPVYERGPAQ